MEVFFLFVVVVGVVLSRKCFNFFYLVEFSFYGYCFRVVMSDISLVSSHVRFEVGFVLGCFLVGGDGFLGCERWDF